MTLQHHEIRIITPTTEYTYTPKTIEPKQPRLTRKYLKKQGITGIGLERCLQAIQLGLNKPIQYHKNGGKNDNI